MAQPCISISNAVANGVIFMCDPRMIRGAKNPRGIINVDIILIIQTPLFTGFDVVQCATFRHAVVTVL